MESTGQIIFLISNIAALIAVIVWGIINTRKSMAISRKINALDEEIIGKRKKLQQIQQELDEAKEQKETVVAEKPSAVQKIEIVDTEPVKLEEKPVLEPPEEKPVSDKPVIMIPEPVVKPDAEAAEPKPEIEIKVQSTIKKPAIIESDKPAPDALKQDKPKIPEPEKNKQDDVFSNLKRDIPEKSIKHTVVIPAHLKAPVSEPPASSKLSPLKIEPESGGKDKEVKDMDFKSALSLTKKLNEHGMPAEKPEKPDIKPPVAKIIDHPADIPEKPPEEKPEDKFEVKLSADVINNLARRLPDTPEVEVMDSVEDLPEMEMDLGLDTGRTESTKEENKPSVPYLADNNMMMNIESVHEVKLYNIQQQTVDMNRLITGIPEAIRHKTREIQVDCKNVFAVEDDDLQQMETLLDDCENRGIKVRLMRVEQELLESLQTAGIARFVAKND